MSSEYAREQPPDEVKLIRFDRFAFDPVSNLLLDDQAIVHLPPKTCELLGVFLNNPGRLLSKAEIMDLVWRDTFVEESNLTHHIAALRKALGNSDLIKTVPRKGYRFVGQLSAEPTIATSVKISITEQKQTKVYEEEYSEGTANLLIVRRKWLAYTGAIFLIGAVAVAGILFAYVRSGQSRSPERRPLTYSTITNSGVNNSASISSDGRLVAYIQNHKNQKGALYVRQVGTNIEKELISDEHSNFGMTGFSPDGAYIYFYQHNTATNRKMLNRVPVLGGPVVLITDRLDNGYFSLSPDGKAAMVVRYDEVARISGLVQIELDGTGRETEVLATSYQEKQLQVGGSWSPDGSKYVLAIRDSAATNGYVRRDLNLAEIDLSSKRLRTLTDETWEAFGISRWMPDSSGIVVIAKKPRLRNQIYFVSYPSGTVRNISNDTNGYSNYGLGITSDGNTLVTDDWKFDGRIWMMDADGDGKTAVRMMQGRPSSTNSGLSQMPDERMVFAARVGGYSDIWILDKDGGSQTPLTSDHFEDTFPVASPDGRWVVFISDRDGEGGKHLYRIGSDGSGLQQLTFGTGNEDTLDISRDGRWIIYHSSFFDAAKNAWSYTIRKIPFDGGEPVQMAENCYAPSFSPDGKKFVCSVFATAESGSFEIRDLDSGALLKSFPTRWSYHHQLPARWTPDGMALVYRDQEKQIGNLWKQRISGGDPVRLTNFTSEIIFNFDFSRDGKKLLISRGSVLVDVVMFTNLRAAVGD
jgi:Tol biopolymer transport system component/DNA-binding winged helix-turn-helix (wHTH) protein